MGIEGYFERLEQLGRVTDSPEMYEMDHHLAVSAAMSEANRDRM
jgi:hypothetical protein